MLPMNASTFGMNASILVYIAGNDGGTGYPVDKGK